MYLVRTKSNSIHDVSGRKLASHKGKQNCTTNRQVANHVLYLAIQS